jgi:processive 1,2-diacylglycerol beta-glucosyltransferase
MMSIVTGSYGSGHDCAARELAREIVSAGGRAEIVDVVQLIPARLGPVLRSTYYTQLRMRPRSWETVLDRLEPGKPLYRWTLRALGTVVAALREAVEGADLVISTHPFASQALGLGRTRGEFAVPAVTYLTDPSVHPLWVHPAVDLHLAIHDVAAEEARGWGAVAQTVRPVVTPSARRPGTAPRFGPGPHALVAGGSLGIGEIERTVDDVLAVGSWTPIVLCGTNDRLRRRLGNRSGVVALGWRDDVPQLMGRADCVLNNGGGFTTVEALTVGVPLVSYRPLPGHGRANAVSLERAGLATYARDHAGLRHALNTALASRAPAGFPSSPLSVVEALAPLVTVTTPLPLAVG